MSDDAILFDVTDGLARITLNRADRLNAVDPEAIAGWRAAAEAVSTRDDIGAVLLDATGRAFCAGGDVRAMSELSVNDPTGGEATVKRLADDIHEGHRMLRESAVPIVAAVQGVVVGGGLGFMLVADVIVASDRATFGSRYADMGLTPDCGVSTLLPEAVGMRRALELTLSDRMLTAAEAYDWGLVAEVVAPDELDARARAIADVWLSGATGAYGQAKRLLHAGSTRSFQDSLDDEARTIGAAFAAPEAQRRVAAFAAASARGA